MEDTDVGFPGPIHAIAERALPMRVAMGVLAVGAVGAGLVQIPKVDFVIDDFLRPTLRRLARCIEPHTRNGLLVFGLVLGTVLGAGGHRDRLPRVGGRARHRRQACGRALHAAV